MHEANVLFQVALAIVAATALAFAAKSLRQPLILGYLAAGILLGPTEGLGLVSPEVVEPIAELGLILLLFMIGLEIDLTKLRAAGSALVAAGVVQFPACVLLGLVIVPILGVHASATGSRSGLYLAVAASLSSTMVVVKLLYDKRALDTLSGRITLGVLVFQDIWAIAFLAVQPNLEDPSAGPLLLSLLKGVALVAFALLVSRFVLPRAFRFIAKVPELLVLSAIGWCFLVAILADELGLSLEMGALIAGVCVSTFPYNMDVVAKVVSLRDFFITLFFVSLGTKIPRPTLDLVLVALGVSGLVVVSRFVTLVPLLYGLRLGTRTSLLPAIHLSQVSEFSLVICSIGLSLGHVDQRTLSIVVYAFALTAVASTYAIQHDHALFGALNPLLARLGMRHRALDEDAPRLPAKDVVLVGFHRQASSLLHELLARDPGLKPRLSVIDFNPQVKDELDRRGIDNVYGDVSHADTLHHASVEAAGVLVCTLPNSMLRGTTNAKLLEHLRRLAPKARVIVTAETIDEAREHHAGGAAWVFVPRISGVAELADAVIAALGGDPEPQRRRVLDGLAGRVEVMP